MIVYLTASPEFFLVAPSPPQGDDPAEWDTWIAATAAWAHECQSRLGGWAVCAWALVLPDDA